jgi:hypothetical protein
LDDRDVALDLIEPTGVDRGLEPDDAGIDLLQSRRRRFAAMRRAVVHDPQQACSGTLWCLRQHWGHELAARRDAGRRFTPAPHLAPAPVPRGQIWQGPPALVRVFATGRAVGGGVQGRMAAVAGWDAGLRVGTEHVVLGAKRLTLPGARRQVQTRSGLLGALRRPWKNPVLVPPRRDGVGRQQPPPGAATDRFTPRWRGARGYIGQGLSTPRWLGGCDQVAGHGRDQRLVQRGNTGASAPAQADLPGRNLLWPSAAANGAPNRGATPPAPRLQRQSLAAPHTLGGPSWRVADAGLEPFAAQRAVGMG